MSLFVSIIILLLGAVALARLSRSIGVPYPSLLALGGAILALTPGTPRITLDPGLALAIFVAPVLLDAAYDASLRDLKENWPPIAGLVFIAVGITTLSVALVFRELVPSASWPVAIALGAIVAPPDAAAATAILRQIKIPHRLVLILEGESLFNDATALLIFGVAVSFAMDQNSNAALILPQYAGSVIVSIPIGIALGWLYVRAFNTMSYAPASIVLQFSATFGVWMLAEALHLSAILTIVAYGLTIGRLAPLSGNPAIRVQSYAVWETVVFLVNILAFVLIGLQLSPLLEKLTSTEQIRYAWIALLILLTVIITRIVWVMTWNTLLRAKNKLYGIKLKRQTIAPTLQGGIVLSWCGMRGIVTLAAALALPPGFPERDLIQVIAFAVVLGTLVVQGFTLAPLIRFLPLPEDTLIARETNLARRTALQGALDSLNGDTSDAAKALRLEFSSILEKADVGEGLSREITDHEALRVKAAQAARQSLLKLWQSGDIGDDAFHNIEAALDRSELYATRYTS